MTKEDIGHLFELLEIYFPNSRKTHDKVLKNAWLLLLEPFAPETVKTALVEQLQSNRNFPDPQAVAVRCREKVPKDMPLVDQCVHSELKSIAWQTEWHKTLKEKGLPTMRDALAQGMTLNQWRRLLEEAGAWE